MKSMAVDLYKQQSKMLHEWIKNNHEKEDRSGTLTCLLCVCHIDGMCRYSIYNLVE